MPTMLRAVALALSLAAAGCQTFIGVEDVQEHLPRLDGTYALSIHWVRDGATDTIRTRALATFDVENRTLDLALVILKAGSNDIAAEGAITGVVFPDDDSTATFAFGMNVPDSAVANPTATKSINVPEMLLRAEAEYSFCGKGGPASPGAPSFGTILLAPGAPVPALADVDSDCDEP